MDNVPEIGGKNCADVSSSKCAGESSMIEGSEGLNCKPVTTTIVTSTDGEIQEEMGRHTLSEISCRF